MIARLRRPYAVGPLLACLLVASGCSAGSGSDPSTSDESVSTVDAEAESSGDEFSEVSVADAPADDEPASTTDEPSADSVADAVSPTDTAAPATSAATDASTTVPPTDEPDPSTDSAAATTTVSASDSDQPDETNSTGASGGPASDDDELAEAFTAQMDADDDRGFNEVFDTVCLGREIVIALGGAEAAAQKYDITADTVEAEAELFGETTYDRADAEAIVAGFTRCGSFDELLLVLLTGSDSADPEAQCVVDALPDGSFENSFASDLQGLEEEAALSFESAVDEAFDECFS